MSSLTLLARAHAQAAALPALALPPLLAAVQMAETHALFGLFRTATVGLADVLIDLGEDEFARGLVEGVYAQVRSLPPSSRLSLPVEKLTLTLACARSGNRSSRATISRSRRLRA